MKIYKYKISELVEMPVNSLIRRVGLDPQGQPCFWAEVDPTSKAVETRAFFVVGTGQDIPPGHEYVGTWITGPFVWHLYERL